MEGLYGGLFLAGVGLALGAFTLARYLNVYSVVDLVWSLGILFGTWGLALFSGIDHPRDGIVLAAVGFWAIRLSLHLFKDRILPRREDPRYANLVTRWGAQAPRNFLFLFFLQLPLAGIFLVPLGLALGNSAPLGILDFLALLLALVALGGEALADRQLAAFRSNPNNLNAVCREGLWRYSRHPNYFFEWLYWWVYVLLSIGSSSFGWSLIGPLIMYIFLRYITGIPPAEYSSLKRRGAAYADYQSSTSPFFPWKPKSNNSEVS
jgi:steroid 5-alpha reductase family enzyme